MLRRKQRLRDVLEVPDPRDAGVVPDERLEHVRRVNAEPRGGQQDEQDARGDHRQVELRAVPLAPAHEVVAAHREEAYEDTWTQEE